MIVHTEPTDCQARLYEVVTTLAYLADRPLAQDEDAWAMEAAIKELCTIGEHIAMPSALTLVLEWAADQVRAYWLLKLADVQQ